MPKAMKRVICIHALLVEAPDDHQAADAMLDTVADKVSNAIYDIFADDECVRPFQMMEYVWIDDDEERPRNIYTCVECGTFGSDRCQPDIVHGLPVGVLSNGQFVCDCCRDEQEIPRGESGSD